MMLNYATVTFKYANFPTFSSANDTFLSNFQNLTFVRSTVALIPSGTLQRMYGCLLTIQATVSIRTRWSKDILGSCFGKIDVFGIVSGDWDVVDGDSSETKMDNMCKSATAWDRIKGDGREFVCVCVNLENMFVEL